MTQILPGLHLVPTSGPNNVALQVGVSGFESRLQNPLSVEFVHPMFVWEDQCPGFLPQPKHIAQELQN